MKTPIALSLGGNLGNVRETFDSAIELMREEKLEEICISRYYVTKPVGCDKGTPDFINAALTAYWHDSLEELFALCKRLEELAGRESNHPRYASRTLDIDIIFFGDAVISNETLTIPHPEATTRLFVLMPLADVASDWIFPGKAISVAKLLNTFHDDPEYLRMSNVV